MPIVLITLALGIALGYWIARKQLAGKFILAEEAMESATWHAIELERELQTRPSTPPAPPLPLSQAWGLPNYHNAPQDPSERLLDLPLTRDDGRPTWTAQWIIGDKFYEIPPTYPGGIEAWKDAHPMKGRGN